MQRQMCMNVHYGVIATAGEKDESIEIGYSVSMLWIEPIKTMMYKHERLTHSKFMEFTVSFLFCLRELCVTRFSWRSGKEVLTEIQIVEKVIFFNKPAYKMDVIWKANNC